MCQLLAPLEPMPLFDAASTTCSRCMLCDENWVPFHGCLFAVIFWKPRGDSRKDKFTGVISDDFDPFIINILVISTGELKFGSKRGFFEGFQLLFYQIIHAATLKGCVFRQLHLRFWNNSNQSPYSQFSPFGDSVRILDLVAFLIAFETAEVKRKV